MRLETFSLFNEAKCGRRETIVPLFFLASGNDLHMVTFRMEEKGG